MKCIRHDCGRVNVPPKQRPRLCKWYALVATGVIIQCSGSIHRRKNCQCWFMQPSPSDYPETVSSPPLSPQFSLPVRVTWRSPSPPPPRMRVSGPRWVAREPDAPHPGRGALVLRTVRSFPRRNRSSRTRGGCDDRSRAPVQVWWWDGGPAALWRWRWWRWCVTPSVHSCMCYCRSELSVWSPAPGSSCSRTFWSQPAPAKKSLQLISRNSSIEAKSRDEALTSPLQKQYMIATKNPWGEE